MIRIILLLALSVSFKVSAQEEVFKAGKINQKRFLEVIDFEIEKGKIIVPVSIENKTYRFILDTGAPNVISEKIQKELNFQTTREKTLISDANGNVDTMQVIGLPRLDIGSLSIENTTSLVSDLHNHQWLQCFDIDGFIGSNSFKNSVIKISLKEKKLYITDNAKKLKPKTKGIDIQFIYGKSNPFIKIELEGENGQKGIEPVLIDTGMDDLYDISNRTFSFFRSKGGIYSQEISDLGVGATGVFGNAEKQEQYQVVVPKIRIGKATLLNVSANTMNDDNSRIGLELLEYGDIIIDYKKKKFYFENTTSEIEFGTPSKIDFTVEDETFMVGFVWDEKLKEQIQYGDKIIRINHLNVKDMKMCEMLTIREQLKGKGSYELEILNQNNETIIVRIEQG